VHTYCEWNRSNGVACEDEGSVPALRGSAAGAEAPNCCGAAEGISRQAAGETSARNVPMSRVEYFLYRKSSVLWREGHRRRAAAERAAIRFSAESVVC
jgi:hypothetical protein